MLRTVYAGERAGNGEGLSFKLVILSQYFRRAAEECDSKQDIVPNVSKFFLDWFVLRLRGHVGCPSVRHLDKDEFLHSLDIVLRYRSLRVPGAPVVRQNVEVCVETKVRTGIKGEQLCGASRVAFEFNPDLREIVRGARGKNLDA
jgi:hypothetical protein